MSPPAVTQYNVQQKTSPRRLEVVQPDGTHHIQLSYNPPSNQQWENGLVFQDEIRDAAGTLLQQTTVTWEPGTFGGYGPRRTRVEVTDERHQLTATGFSYGPAYNQVTDVQEYDYGGTQVLRTVHTDYEPSPSYAARHIFNLPTGISVFRGQIFSGVRESQTNYIYDGQLLANTPAIFNHDDASNPFAPRVWLPTCSRQCDTTVKPPLCRMVCDGGQWQNLYQSATDLRGNVTQITRYTNPAAGRGAITETRRYDIAGNVVSVSSAPGAEERFEYTAATQYAYPTADVRGQPQLAKTHIASDEFLGVQGYQQWSYLESDNAQMTYDNNTGVWKSSASNVALIPRGGLPDDGVDAIRRWTAPAGGRVHITGNAHSLNPAGTRIANNVVVSIRQGAQTLWQATLNSWDASGPAFDIATVVAPGRHDRFRDPQKSLGECCGRRRG